MRMLARFLGFVFATATIVFLIGAIAGSGLIYYFSKDLPDTAQLQDYEPPVMTRLHAADGTLLAEYSHERRLYPAELRHSASWCKQRLHLGRGQEFLPPPGFDPEGIMRAAIGARPGRAAMSRAPRPSPSRSPRTSC